MAGGYHRACCCGGCACCYTLDDQITDPIWLCKDDVKSAAECNVLSPPFVTDRPLWTGGTLLGGCTKCEETDCLPSPSGSCPPCISGPMPDFVFLDISGCHWCGPQGDDLSSCLPFSLISSCQFAQYASVTNGLFALPRRQSGGFPCVWSGSFRFTFTGSCSNGTSQVFVDVGYQVRFEPLTAAPPGESLIRVFGGLSAINTGLADPSGCGAGGGSGMRAGFQLTLPFDFGTVPQNTSINCTPPITLVDMQPDFLNLNPFGNLNTWCLSELDPGGWPGAKVYSYKNMRFSLYI